MGVFRCLKGEGEIEKLQAKVVELRRKLEDTTAAMQELGRENQSLQVSRETFANLKLRQALKCVAKMCSCHVNATKVDPTESHTVGAFRSNSHSL